MLLTFAFPPVVLSAEPSIGTVTALRGTVVIHRPGAGAPLAAKEGTPFLVGDVVKTDSGSAAQLSLTDESFMNMAAGASVRVNQYSFDPAADRRTTIIRVLEGKVRFIVFRPRRAGSSFRVDAGSAMVTAGSLADFVAVAGRGHAEISVLEQALSVKNSLSYVVGTVSVGGNQRTVVREKQPPSMPEVISPQERKELLKDVKNI